MKLTKKALSVAAAGALMAAGTILVAGAPAASAEPTPTPEIQVGNGSVTLTWDIDIYPSWTGFFCSAETLEVDCTWDTYLYNTISPGTYTAGSGVYDPNSIVPELVPLPAGTYTVVVVDEGDFPQGAVSGVSISATGVTGPPVWWQSIGKLAGTECPSGWSSSWAQWAVPVTGGGVCNRVVFWQGSRWMQAPSLNSLSAATPWVGR
jgi:hypothetical protein